MHDLRWRPLHISDVIRLNGTQLELPLQSTKRLRWVIQEDVFSQNRHEGATLNLVENEVIASLFGLAALCSEQEFLFCTKHIGRKLDWFDWVEDDMAGPIAKCLQALREGVGITAIEEESHLDQKWPLKNVTVMYFIGNKIGVRCE